MLAQTSVRKILNGRHADEVRDAPPNRACHGLTWWVEKLRGFGGSLDACERPIVCWNSRRRDDEEIPLT